MNKIISISCLVILALFLLNFECGTPIGYSNNEPTIYQPLDTLNPTHFANPIEIPISVTVWEFDRPNLKYLPVPQCTVHFFNNDLKILTDSNGNAKSTFFIDSMLYKYGFRMEKNGYNSVDTWRWDTLRSLTENREIYITNSLPSHRN